MKAYSILVLIIAAVLAFGAINASTFVPIITKNGEDPINMILMVIMVFGGWALAFRYFHLAMLRVEEDEFYQQQAEEHYALVLTNEQQLEAELEFDQQCEEAFRAMHRAALKRELQAIERAN
jgi:hypothetical protein